MARMIVCGSSEWRDAEGLERVLDFVVGDMRCHGHGHPLVVHGADMAGADGLADAWALSRGFEREPHPAAWEVTDETPVEVVRHRRGGEPYDVTAGRRRNEEMVRLGAVIAVGFTAVLPCTPGTAHCLGLARGAGIAALLYGPDCRLADYQWWPRQETLV